MSSNKEQPSIAEVLGITYKEPISDAEGWSEAFPEDPNLAPAPPHKNVFYGPLGELTRTIAPHVPWDPMGFHMQALVGIGNYLGYPRYVEESENQHHPNLFLALIGESGSGKGSSLAFVRTLMNQVDADYFDKRVITGMGSGEGLLVKITDEITGMRNGKEEVTRPDSGDKRVLYTEEELGGLLDRMKSRETIETTITQAWDSKVMETGVKNDNMRCREPHVSIIGHITKEALDLRLHQELRTNGYSNRWLYMLVKPVALIPTPPPMREMIISPTYVPPLGSTPKVSPLVSPFRGRRIHFL